MSELPVSAPLLQVDDLHVRFPVRVGGFLRPQRRMLHAVNGVSFAIQPGETVGIVGESGCGKSTLARAILQLISADEGQIVWMGEDLRRMSPAAVDAKRDELQIVFQDPLSSHNPRMTIGAIIGEPLTLFRRDLDETARRAAVLDMMRQVGLGEVLYNRYPHELSGGQCQRVSIARAVILRPRLLVCDEPVSALDVSTQAQIINLIRSIQREFGMAVIFISHDLSVVRYVCQRILVMYLGHLIESGTRDDLFERPLHPYTQALINAVPTPDPARQRKKLRQQIKGEIPSPLNPPSGCVFRTRCPFANPVCIKRFPDLERAAEGHDVACHHWQRIAETTPFRGVQT
jgi:oligopeptide transport system ATP-binding protein